MLKAFPVANMIHRQGNKKIECHRCCRVVSFVQSFIHDHDPSNSSHFVLSHVVSLARERFTDLIVVKRLIVEEIIRIRQIHAFPTACWSNMWTVMLSRTSQHLTLLIQTKKASGR